ncbi:MAG: hypothetical protein R3B93_04585 [Bacteroidia bacterium]
MEWHIINRRAYLLMSLMAPEVLSGDVEILITKDTTNVLLPVKISQFEGQYKEGSNWLFWETELEQNHDYFGIQKSEDRNVCFFKSGFGAGKQSGNTEIFFEDSHPQPGITYYQLKSVDINGRSSFSEIISVVPFNLWK